MAIVNVRGLGESAVEVDGRAVQRWQQTKPVLLFHYLLDRRGRVVDRSTLTGTFWPSEEAVAPEVSLKVAVHGLRRMLDNAFGRGHAPVIETHNAGYRLAPDGLSYDVEEFERVVAEANRSEARGDRQRAVDRYRHALALYRGDFLAGANDSWIQRRRLALVDQCLLVLTRLAEFTLEAGDYQACIAHCLDALEREPCRERTYQLLMLCHAGLGQYGRVAAWWELCRQTLRETIAAEVSLATELVFMRCIRNEEHPGWMRSGAAQAHLTRP
jgi:two-component SAPR family response regulator